MPASKRIATRTVLSLALGLIFVSASQAQNIPPAPRIGGNGTLEGMGGQNNGAAGNGGATRQRLSPLTAVPQDFSKLKLGPGFLLNMQVYEAPEYSTELRVDQAGNVDVPTVGGVHVADLTLLEASQKIAAAFRESKMLTDPHINLNVEEYAGQQVTVLGEVRTPGPVEVLAPRRLDDVLALAGGETEYAGNKIEIRHEAGKEPRTEVVNYSRSADNHVLRDTLIIPGDTVTIKRAGIVYVLGGVTRPGGYVMQEDGNLNVTEALSLAYGTTLGAAVSSMHVIRKTDDGKVEDIPIHYHDMVKGKVPPLSLQAEDVIYVPISKVKTILGAGLLNTAVSAAVIYR